MFGMRAVTAGEGRLERSGHAGLRPERRAGSSDSRVPACLWLRDESLDDSQNLQPPDVIAAEIVENLEAALEQFTEIYQELSRTEDALSSADPLPEPR